MIPDHLTMESSQAPSYMETVQVTSSTTSSIHVAWEVNHDTSSHVEGFRVHYQKVASTYVQYGPMLSASIGQYSIQNLVADTYYKVCLVMYRNDTQPIRECVDASTTNWHIPVSIGSSIGAILALSMIVLVVLVSRCPSVVKWRGKQYKKSQKYDSMSSHYHDDHFEFSDTATHGHEDEFVSEFDPCNEYSFENAHNNSHSKEHRSTDKMCNGNRNHVSSISHSQATKYMGARPKVYIPSHYPHHSYHGHQTNSSLAHSIERQQSLDLGQREDLNHNHHHSSGVHHHHHHHHHHNSGAHHHHSSGVTLTSPVQSYGPAELESNSAYIRPDEGPEEIVYSEARASSPPNAILQSATDYEMKEIKKSCSQENCVAAGIIDHQEEHTL
ncbi:probable zinc transporter protein DDB_G0269332 [Pecten maximus]|uniref:probable zinc transporter protein DDB_G0269332 n=1 Tax=Pecten maximus TaxID=6579 RepID=UPI0014585197|nr:probable zinc transporter protein DDB_G0269332 [Pecten maximus]